MDPESFKEFEKLKVELESSSGWIWEQRIITHLGSTFQIFQANRVELCRAILWFEDGKESFQLLDVNKRESLHQFLREVMRLFHNYLASVATLRDHTRKILNDFESEGHHLPEYLEHVSQHFDTPESQFIQISRNYMLHNSCIFTGSKLHWDQSGGFVLSITFGLQDLKKWDKWNAKSREFIDTQSEDPSLLPLINEYSKHMLMSFIIGLLRAWKKCIKNR